MHGSRLKGKWNLVRMRGDGKRENWLLIKTDDAHASKDTASDFLEGLSSSVTTGGSMDEIALMVRDAALQVRLSRLYGRPLGKRKEEFSADLDGTTKK
jgi:ATP-dependent DNA ligase